MVGQLLCEDNNEKEKAEYQLELLYGKKVYVVYLEISIMKKILTVHLIISPTSISAEVRLSTFPLYKAHLLNSFRLVTTKYNSKSLFKAAEWTRACIFTQVLISRSVIVDLRADLLRIFFIFDNFRFVFISNIYKSKQYLFKSHLVQLKWLKWLNHFVFLRKTQSLNEYSRQYNTG